MTTETSLSALPVRQRGTLEIIDTAMKLYRRYFGVLMKWSALVIFISTITYPFGLLLSYPLVAGSCACAIAAAVRGQSISFGQVWEFSKPRYGGLVLVTFVSGLLMTVAIGVIALATTLLGVAGAWMLSAINAPSSVTAVAAVLGVLIATLAISVLSVLAYAWLGLAPIIACLEDDKRSLAALSRAWELMKNSWGRVMGLATLLTIAIAAFSGIVMGTMALLGQSLDLFSANSSVSSVITLVLAYAGFFGAFFLFWNPIQNLVLAVLYLDLRVRKEALDLEWSSYASAPPPVENNALAATPAAVTAQEVAAQLAQNPLNEGGASEMSPASMSPALNISAPVEIAPVIIRPPAPLGNETNSDAVALSKPPSPQVSSHFAPETFAPNAFDSSTSFSAGTSDDEAGTPGAE